jgi:hypothetical protein
LTARRSRATWREITQARVKAVSAIAGLSALLTGCSFCAGSGCTTSGTDLAKEVQQQFGKYAKVHHLPPLPPVTCPNAIRNEAGAKTVCYAKGDLGAGHRGILPIKVTVTSANGSTVNLHFETGQVQPLGSSTTSSQTTRT